MRRQDKEVTEPEKIAEIINKAEICHLGLVDGERAYVVPLNFGFDGRRLYLHSAREGKKIDLLKKNPNVCFEMVGQSDLAPGEQACGFTTYFSSVIGFGRARIIEDGPAKVQALDVIMAHHNGPQGGYKDKALAAMAVIVIDIEEMTGKVSRPKS